MRVERPLNRRRIVVSPVLSGPLQACDVELRPTVEKSMARIDADNSPTDIFINCLIFKRQIDLAAYLPPKLEVFTPHFFGYYTALKLGYVKTYNANIRRTGFTSVETVLPNRSSTKSGSHILRSDLDSVPNIFPASLFYSWD